MRRSKLASGPPGALPDRNVGELGGPAAWAKAKGFTLGIVRFGFAEDEFVYFLHVKSTTWGIYREFVLFFGGS